jgi:hypothetical protein
MYRAPTRTDGTPRPTLANTKPARMGHPATQDPPLQTPNPQGWATQEPPFSNFVFRVSRFGTCSRSPLATSHSPLLLCYVAVHSLAPSASCEGSHPRKHRKSFMER